MNLIRIANANDKSDLKELLDELRAKSDASPSDEEIIKEVEAVRASRYEK